MVSLVLNDDFVTTDEASIRRRECELEYADLLLNHSGEVAAAAREAITFGSERGLTHWQSVLEYARRHTRDYEHLLSQPELQAIEADFLKRFDDLYVLLGGMKREVGNACDDRLHAHAATVANGIHTVKWLANEKRGAYEGGNALSLSESAVTVDTQIVSRIYDLGPARQFASMPRGPRIAAGAVAMSTAPVVGAKGQILEDRREIGSVIIHNNAAL